MGSVKKGSKIQADSCLLTGKFWVGGLTNEAEASPVLMSEHTGKRGVN